MPPFQDRLPPPSMSESPSIRDRLVKSAGSSLFWPVLLLAAVLHAGAALSPALVESLELDEAHAGRVAAVERLGRSVAQLQRMERALLTDSGYRTRVARSQIGADPGTGELQVALAEELRFDPLEGGDAPAVVEAVHPWYESLVRELGSAGPLRQRCVAGAAILCLAAFVFLPARPDGEPTERKKGTQDLSPDSGVRKVA